MKKKRTGWLLAAFFALGLAACGGVTTNVTAAEGDIEINATNFPDENFRSYLEGLSSGSDGVFTTEEIQSITNISVEYKDICDLTGVEHFTALTYLCCYKNQLTNLDVSKNTALETLDCGNNQLTSLNVSKNTALAELYCAENQLVSLDVSHNIDLTYLKCSENQLTNLDVSKNTKLTDLDCDKNQLTGLDVSRNTALINLDCENNQLTNLDVSGDIALESLCCVNNRLNNLDVSNNIKLTSLECEKNKLISLNVSNNTLLWLLSCDGNQLTSIDVSRNTALETLDCGNNQLTSLDVSNNTVLDVLYCDNNTYMIDTQNHIFDLSKLPGSFDVNKASNWSGGSVSNGILTVDDGAESVTYKYDCGNDKTVIFTLNVSEKTEQHTHTATLHIGKAATCGAAGEKDYYACTCGKVFEDEACTKEITDLANWKVIAATGKHTYGDWKSDADGHSRTCTVCGTTAKEAHTPGAAATTTSAQICTVCGYEIAPKLPEETHTHTAILHTGKKATCGTAGEKDYYTCACGKVFEDEACTKEITDLDSWKVIPATGKHTYGDWKSDADGHSRTCTVCGTTAKEAHTPGAAATTTSAQVCTVCGYEIAPKLPEGSHTHTGTLHTGKSATCGAAGERDYYICTCGKVFEDEACTKEITDFDSWKVIPATGNHTLKTSTTKATLKKDGCIKTACSVCGKVTEEKTISRPAAIKLARTSFIYDGKAKTPSVNVTDANGKAIASGNYDLAYASGRKNVGAYTVKVTFKGNYSGTKTLSFTINPKGTSLSKIKAGKKKLTVKWKKQASQTTGYQIQYSLKKNFKSAKTLTVNKNKTISKAVTKLKAKKKYFVRIRTYKTVNGKKYCSSWSKVKSATTKK